MKLDIAVALHDPDSCPIERSKYVARRRAKKWSHETHKTRTPHSYLPPKYEIRRIAQRIRAIIISKFNGELTELLDNALLILKHEGAIKNPTAGWPGDRQAAMELALQLAIDEGELVITRGQNGIVRIIADDVSASVTLVEIDRYSAMFSHCSSRHLAELACH